jgi:hypothetical protein
MIITPISRQFESQEGITLLTQIIDMKIKFHESKIQDDATEEDIKYRESKIIQLQRTRNEITNREKFPREQLNIVADTTIS